MLTLETLLAQEAEAYVGLIYRSSEMRRRTLAEVPQGSCFQLLDRVAPIGIRLSNVEGRALVLELGQAPQLSAYLSATPCWQLPAGELVVRAGQIGDYSSDFKPGEAVFSHEHGLCIVGQTGTSIGARSVLVSLAEFDHAQPMGLERTVSGIEILWQSSQPNTQAETIWRAPAK